MYLKTSLPSSQDLPLSFTVNYLITLYITFSLWFFKILFNNIPQSRIRFSSIFSLLGARIKICIYFSCIHMLATWPTHLITQIITEIATLQIATLQTIKIVFRLVRKIAKSGYKLRHVCPSVCLSVCLCLSVSVRLSVCPSVCPSVCLSICLSVLFWRLLPKHCRCREIL